MARLTARVGRRTKKGTLVTQAIQDAANADDAVKLVILEDNAEAIRNATNQALMRALETIGIVAERYAKALCPVDTGRLRNSITHALDNDTMTVSIGTNVEYAEAQEFGTRKRKAANDGRGFLRPAANDHVGEYRRIIEDELRNG